MPYVSYLTCEVKAKQHRLLDLQDVHPVLNRCSFVRQLPISISSLVCGSPCRPIGPQVRGRMALPKVHGCQK